MRDELRSKRETQEISIRKMAALTYMDKNRYNKIELGRIDPTPDEASRICKVLGCECLDVLADMIPKYQKEAEIRSALASGTHIKAV